MRDKEDEDCSSEEDDDVASDALTLSEENLRLPPTFSSLRLDSETFLRLELELETSVFP